MDAEEDILYDTLYNIIKRIVTKEKEENKVSLEVSQDEKVS
ncbi:hypothetical protein CLPU_6c00140 [Gottschalkia purinilytica]|uniref:Uncharacterized protein n=1 Tax=Gottschalkia purinilytica TaxID=1503 RepID=A0A0L0WAH8_GOTPU|nr:hypothetical protein [Gottschalkia purinilytica]KNF08528.1 hypothetical protein CLPU_6c00140 [Gottschalkia purinilytica]